jgi:hypothetical protein
MTMSVRTSAVELVGRAHGELAELADHPVVCAVGDAVAQIPSLLNKSIAGLASIVVPADYSTAENRGRYVENFHCDVQSWLLTHHENILDVFGTEEAYATELAARLRAQSSTQFLDAIVDSVGAGRLHPVALGRPAALGCLREQLPRVLEASSLHELGELATRPYFKDLVLKSPSATGQYATQLRNRINVASLYGPENLALVPLLVGKAGDALFLGRPEWAPDSAAICCTRCSVTFSLYTRRHHCRLCGKIFCADCSSGCQKIEGLGRWPVRTCRICATGDVAAAPPECPEALKRTHAAARGRLVKLLQLASQSVGRSVGGQAVQEPLGAAEFATLCPRATGDLLALCRRGLLSTAGLIRMLAVDVRRGAPLSAVASRCAGHGRELLTLCTGSNRLTAAAARRLPVVETTSAAAESCEAATARLAAEMEELERRSVAQAATAQQRQQATTDDEADELWELYQQLAWNELELAVQHTATALQQHDEPPTVAEPPGWVLELAGWGTAGWCLLPQPLLAQLADAVRRNTELTANQGAATNGGRVTQLWPELRAVCADWLAAAQTAAREMRPPLPAACAEHCLEDGPESGDLELCSSRQALQERNMELERRLFGHDDWNGTIEMADIEYARWGQRLDDLRHQEDEGGGEGRLHGQIEQANAELDKWWGRLSAHPDWVNQENADWNTWEETEAGRGRAALGWLRSVVPANIASHASETSLVEGGLHPDAARRICSHRVLWLCRSAGAEAIRAIHANDWKTMYSCQGLDLIELRAVLVATAASTRSARLPPAMTAWRTQLREQLKEAEQEAAQPRADSGGLNGNRHRHQAYESYAPAFGQLQGLPDSWPDDRAPGPFPMQEVTVAEPRLVEADARLLLSSRDELSSPAAKATREVATAVLAQYLDGMVPAGLDDRVIGRRLVESSSEGEESSEPDEESEDEEGRWDDFDVLQPTGSSSLFVFGEEGSLGLTFDSGACAGGPRRVASVEPGSQAEALGVPVGLFLLTIDGAPAFKGEPWGAVRSRLQSRPLRLELTQALANTQQHAVADEPSAPHMPATADDGDGSAVVVDGGTVPANYRQHGGARPRGDADPTDIVAEVRRLLSPRTTDAPCVQ